jgi:hypothetical protein
MIRLQRDSNFGDAAFQYCFARTLATNWNYELSAPSLPGFPNTESHVHGIEVLGPVAFWEGNWPFDSWSGRSICPEELSRPAGTRLTLRGSFQRFDLIAPARDEIRHDWLKTEPVFSYRGPEDFLICLWIGPKRFQGQASLSPEEVKSDR